LPTLRRASGEIAVRLAQFDAAKTLDVFGADTPKNAHRAHQRRRADPERRQANRSSCSHPIHERWLRIASAPTPAECASAARSDGQLEVTNLVDLEDYVAGVVAADIAVCRPSPKPCADAHDATRPSRHARGRPALDAARRARAAIDVRCSATSATRPAACLITSRATANPAQVVRQARPL